MSCHVTGCMLLALLYPLFWEYLIYAVLVLQDKL